MKIKYLQGKKSYFITGTNTPSLNVAAWIWMGSNLKSVPSTCLKVNVSCCAKNLTFRTKNALFRYFGEQIEKDIAIFAISALELESFMQNVKNFNLGPKLPSLDWHFWLLTYLKSAPSNLSKCKISLKSTKPYI